LLLALLSAVALPAYADKPKYTRHAATPSVSFTPRTAPVQTAQPAPAKPEVNANDLMRIELELQPLRVEQGAVLSQLANDTPDDDPTKPEILFRLAEHYARQHRFWHMKAIEQTLTKP
jgi:hypothetical protein